MGFPGCTTSRLLTVTGMLVLAVDSSRAALAQPLGRSVIRGRISTDSGRVHVKDAEVAVDEATRSVRSDSSGVFSIGGLAAGTYTVRIKHPAWKPVVGRVTLADADTVELNVAMVPLGVLLPEVEVSGRYTPPGLRDFERRRATTGGTFLTAAQIQASGAQSLSNLIMGKVSGYEVVPLVQGGHAIATRRTFPSLVNRMEGNTCFSQIWLDGQLIFYTRIGGGPPPRLEDFDLDKISGIEFYGASSVPPELNGPGGECGTVAIWMAVPRPNARRPD